MSRRSWLLLLLVVAFAAVALARHDCLDFNQRTLLGIRESHSDSLTSLAIGLTVVGDTPGVLLITVAAVVLLLRLRKPRPAVMLAVVMILGSSLNAILKQIFADPRPALFASPYPATGFSFPSGHAQAAIGLYGTLALLAGRWFVALPCAMIAASICWCRLYLGVHWPTDVLAGAFLGATVIVIVRCVLPGSETYFTAIPPSK